MDLFASLSSRAGRYLTDWCRLVAAPEVQASWETADQLPTTGPAVASPDLLRAVYGVESGLAMPILGGDLYGWTRIGPPTSGGWVSDDGVPVVRLADHSEAQCTPFLTLDGRLGVAWPGKDLARYSHLTHFIEASSAWTTIAGWHYADAVSGHAGLVISVLDGSGLRLVPEASGELVRWWLGEDVAVYSEAELTASFERPPYVLVLAATAERAQEVRRELRQAIEVKRPEYFLTTVPAVGRDFPAIPAGWGPARRINPDPGGRGSR